MHMYKREKPTHHIHLWSLVLPVNMPQQLPPLARSYLLSVLTYTQTQSPPEPPLSPVSIFLLLPFNLRDIA